MPWTHPERRTISARSWLVCSTVFFLGACATGTPPPCKGSGCGNGGDGGEGGSGTCVPGSLQTCYSGPEETKGVGFCKSGTAKCRDDGLGYGPCEGEVLPSEESCTVAGDEDCDGLENEEGAGCVCTPGTGEPCYTGPDGTEGTGACVGGTRTCDVTGLGYGSCMGEVTPSEEDCANAADDDCNGIACGEPVWAGGLGSAGIETIQALTSDTLGNVYVVATFSGQIDFSVGTVVPLDAPDLLVLKLDADGVPIWVTNLLTNGDVTVGGAEVGPDGQLAISGTIPANGYLEIGPDILGDGLDSGFVGYLATTDGTPIGGSSIQTVVLGQPKDTRCNEVHWRASVPWVGCWAFTGALGFGFVQSDELVPQQVASFDAPTLVDVDFTFLPDDSTILAGRFKGALKHTALTWCPAAPTIDWFVGRFDPAGNPTWVKCFGTTDDDVGAPHVGGDSAGNTFATAVYAANLTLGATTLTADGEDTFLAKLDPNGAFQWSKRLGGPGAQLVKELVVTPSDGPMVAGSLNAQFDEGLAIPSPVGVDGFVAEIDPGGAVVWERLISGTASNDCSFLARDWLGPAFYAAGQFAGDLDMGAVPLPQVGMGDVWIARIGR